MEEDIMILESECYYLEELGYLRENNHFIRFNQALENLIKGYRELEEENRIFALARSNIELKRHVEKNYIPKSKIKETKEENEKRIDEMRPYKHQAPFDFGVLNGIDECCRKLLEDK